MKRKKRKSSHAGLGSENPVKKRFSRKNLIAIFFAIIMVGSLVGIFSTSLMGPGRVLSVNGHSYSYDEKFNVWTTEIDDSKLVFYNLPDQLQNIPINGDAINLLKTSVILQTTYEPDSELKNIFASIQFELQENIISKNNGFVIYAFTKENEFNKPIITCNNATYAQPVLFFNQINNTQETGLIMDKNCMIFNAQDEYDAKALRDELFYNLYGLK